MLDIARTTSLVDQRWSDDIVTTLVEYIKIPNSSARSFRKHICRHRAFERVRPQRIPAHFYRQARLGRHRAGAGRPLCSGGRTLADGQQLAIHSHRSESAFKGLRHE